jgi:hypothetical protein
MAHRGRAALSQKSCQMLPGTVGLAGHQIAAGDGGLFQTSRSRRLPAAAGGHLLLRGHLLRDIVQASF